MSRDPLEYALNRMERAAQSDDPAKNGYGPARKELLDGIASLRADLAAANAAKEEAERKLCAASNVIPQINQLARVMQEKLDKNAHKGGWIRYDAGGNRIWNKDMVEFLKSKLLEEVNELFAEIEYPGQVVKRDLVEEAADVANIAMMIADCYGAIPTISPSPCRHEAEADKYKEAYETVQILKEGVSEANEGLRERDAEAVKIIMAVVGNSLLNDPIFDKLLARARAFYADAALKGEKG